MGTTGKSPSRRKKRLPHLNTDLRRKQLGTEDVLRECRREKNTTRPSGVNEAPNAVNKSSNKPVRSDGEDRDRGDVAHG